MAVGLTLVAAARIKNPSLWWVEYSRSPAPLLFTVSEPADSGKATLPCFGGKVGVETGRNTTLLALVLMERKKKSMFGFDFV